jgi:hypothetical protein
MPDISNIGLNFGYLKKIGNSSFKWLTCKFVSKFSDWPTLKNCPLPGQLAVPMIDGTEYVNGNLTCLLTLSYGINKDYYKI